MVGHQVWIRIRPRSQDVGDRSMHHLTLRQQDTVVDRFSNERMVEPIAVGWHFPHQTRVKHALENR